MFQPKGERLDSSSRQRGGCLAAVEVIAYPVAGARLLFVRLTAVIPGGGRVGGSRGLG